MVRRAVLNIFIAVTVLLAAAAAGGQGVGPGYDIEMSRMIPMRDGVQIESWIFKPSHLKANAPAVLMLTQYDIDWWTPWQRPRRLQSARLCFRAAVLCAAALGQRKERQSGPAG